MFSFKDGRPLAKIEGGKYDGKILFIDTNEKSKSKINNITLTDGKLIPLPNIDTRDVVHIGGPSGSGKSTYAANYMKNYKKIFPENEIYVFSRLDSDEVIDKLDPARIPIDESLIDDPIDIQTEMSNGALVLFDDIDTIKDDKIRHAVNQLKNDILETGRHMNIYCVNTSHLINPNDKKDARTIMNELTSLTFFPKAGNSHAIKYALKTYFGIDEKIIKLILQLPSRWVTVYRTYPQTVLYEKGAFIL